MACVVRFRKTLTYAIEFLGNFEFLLRRREAHVEFGAALEDLIRAVLKAKGGDVKRTDRWGKRRFATKDEALAFVRDAISSARR